MIRSHSAMQLKMVATFPSGVASRPSFWSWFGEVQSSKNSQKMQSVYITPSVYWGNELDRPKTSSDPMLVVGYMDYDPKLAARKMKENMKKRNRASKWFDI